MINCRFHNRVLGPGGSGTHSWDLPWDKNAKMRFHNLITDNMSQKVSEATLSNEQSFTLSNDTRLQPDL